MLRRQRIVRHCIEAPRFGGRDSIGGASFCSASSSGFLAAIAEGSHPIPSRTRKLSPPAPMVLQGRPCGRVGRCQIYGPEVLCGTSGSIFLKGGSPRDSAFFHWFSTPRPPAPLPNPSRIRQRGQSSAPHSVESAGFDDIQPQSRSATARGQPQPDIEARSPSATWDPAPAGCRSPGSVRNRDPDSQHPRAEANATPFQPRAEIVTSSA